MVLLTRLFHQAQLALLHSTDLYLVYLHSCLFSFASRQGDVVTLRKQMRAYSLMCQRYLNSISTAVKEQVQSADTAVLPALIRQCSWLV